MDDANVPSLLAMPYLGYCSYDDPKYLRTRQFVLSEDNPYYYKGRYAAGVGSPHTPPGYVWHIGQPEQFTREWFGWANSLVGQFILQWLESHPMDSQR